MKHNHEPPEPERIHVVLNPLMLSTQPVEERKQTSTPQKEPALTRGGYTRHWPLLLLLGVILFGEVSWLVSLAPTDIARYECYGLTFWLGGHATTLLPHAQCAFLSSATPQTALHMLPLEYPPLTVLLFSLPLLVPLPYYALTFALLMTLIAVAIYWLLARSAAPKAAPIFALYLGLAALAVAQERFDLVPAACTLVCVLAAERGRWRTAYLVLALGVLLKLYPIVLLPALFLAEQRAYASIPSQRLADIWTSPTRWQNCLLFFALLIGVMGLFALLNVNEALMRPLSYFFERPAQIESLLGSLIWAGGVFGASWTTAFDHGSVNISSALLPILSPLNTVATIGGLLVVLWLQWRKNIDLAQTCVALLSVLIATGKVFSPQYLIWIIPLLAYIYARGLTSRVWMACWAAISLLTTLIYLVYYSALPNPATTPTPGLNAAASILATRPGFFELVALRNVLLLLATLALLCGWWGARRRATKSE